MDIEADFMDWFSKKSKIKVSDKDLIGQGVEGKVYAVGNNKVLKITYPSIAHTNQYFLNRDIQGLVKVYQAGLIRVPMRFKYPNGTDTNSWDSYSGIDLLEPDRTFGKGDVELGYILMEKVKTSKKLEADLKGLDELWYEFKKHEYSDATNDVIIKANRGFGVALLESLFANINNESFTKDLIEFVATKDEKLYALLEELIPVAKNISSLEIVWGDVHHQQFGYNTKGMLTAFDVNFSNTQTMNPSDVMKKIDKLKFKNVIQEEKL